MANLLGTVSGQLKVDVSQAVAAYAAARSANAATMTAIERSRKSVNDVSNAFLGVGVAIAGALGYAAEQAAQFNAEMDYFQAVSKATTSQMDAIRKKAIELDQTTMFSTEDIATMFTQLAKSGESVNEILGGVADACTNLAQAAQIPLTNATKDVVTIMSAFNLKASDAAMVANELAGASNNSVLSVDDLATSMKYAGAVADTLHVSMQDTTTALTLMGRAGIQGSMGGTELRQMFLQLTAPTAAATKELQKLGIITKNGTNQLFNANGTAKSLAQVFQILQNATSKMGAEQQTAALKTIFNSRALAGAEILTKAGAKGFDQMNAAINKTTAADVAAKRMDNLQGSVKILTSSLKTMAIGAGQPLQQFLTQVVRGVTSLVQGFSHLSPQTQSLIIHIVAIVGGLALFLGIVGKAISIGLGLWKTITDLGMAFKFLWGLGESLIGMVRTLTVALMENPIALIAVAVIALGIAFYELYEHCTSFRNAINDIGRWFKSVFEDTVNWFKKVPQYFEDGWNAIKNVFTTGIDWIKTHWKTIVAWLIDPVGEAFKLLWDKFGGQITAFFGRMWSDAVDGMSKFGKAVLTELGKLPDQIAYWTGFILGRLIRWIVELNIDIVKGFGDMMAAIVRFFEQLPGRVMQYGKDLYNDWVNLQLRMVHDATQWGQDIVNAIVGFFERLPGDIENFAISIYNKWTSFQTRMKSDATKWGSELINDIVGFFSRLPGEIWNWVESTYNKFVTFMGQMKSKAEQMGQDVVNGIVNWVSQIPSLMGNIMSNVISTLESWVSKAFDAAKNFAGSLWNGFKKGLGINSPSFIEKQMTQIGECMDTETRNINKYVKQIQGLGSQLQGNNPLLASTNYSAMTAAQMQANLNSQLRQLNVTGAVSVPGYTTVSSNAYGNGGLGGQPTKVLEVNVFNPTAESSASSTTKQLQTLANLGAF
jgi:TP901 family phage tail tape measure protein